MFLLLFLSLFIFILFFTKLTIIIIKKKKKNFMRMLWAVSFVGKSKEDENGVVCFVGAAFANVSRGRCAFLGND